MSAKQCTVQHLIEIIILLNGTFLLQAAFFEYKQGGGSVTDIKISPNETFVVSCNFEGSILLWNLKDYQGPIIKI